MGRLYASDSHRLCTRRQTLHPLYMEHLHLTVRDRKNDETRNVKKEKKYKHLFEIDSCDI